MELDAQAAVKIASDEDGVFLVGVDVELDNTHERGRSDSPKRPSDDNLRPIELQRGERGEQSASGYS